MALASAPMLALAHDDEREDDDDDDDVRRGGVTFEHGVASGDPLRHRVMPLTRGTPNAASNRRARGVLVRWVIALDSQLRHVVGRGALRTGPERTTR
jgi:phosphodiesterase/alkaline phosphatase D-like protein